MRILKFGGKSLSTPEKMQNICKNIKKIYKNDKKIIVVVSAIGKTTDNLLSLASDFYPNGNSPRELDVLLSTGEMQSASLFAMVLNSMGVPAKSLLSFQLQISTFGAYQNSKIAYINKEPILNCFENNEVAVVAGFQGINKNNDITTLGRGGSDTTASALGAVFNQSVEIYSDFNGVFCGDPRVLNYKKINRINYDAMINLANSGAKVLDSRATEIAKKFNFKIISKSSTKPNLSGTIVSGIESDIISVSIIENICQISIIYTNKENLKFIIKNVINELNYIKFYNLNIKEKLISFEIETKNKNALLSNLSKKLNLISKK